MNYSLRLESDLFKILLHLEFLLDLTFNGKMTCNLAARVAKQYATVVASLWDYIELYLPSKYAKQLRTYRCQA